MIVSMFNIKEIIIEVYGKFNFDGELVGCFLSGNIGLCVVKCKLIFVGNFIVFDGSI